MITQHEAISYQFVLNYYNPNKANRTWTITILRAYHYAVYN